MYHDSDTASAQFVYKGWIWNSGIMELWNIKVVSRFPIKEYGPVQETFFCFSEEQNKNNFTVLSIK